VSSCCDDVNGSFSCAPPCGQGISSSQATTGRTGAS
jgi:hypothetical protein